MSVLERDVCIKDVGIREISVLERYLKYSLLSSFVPYLTAVYSDSRTHLV